MPDHPDRSSTGIDQCNNPYDSDTHAYRAYREGWEARRSERTYTSNPYEKDGTLLKRAWMSGWQAAHLRVAQQPSPS